MAVKEELSLRTFLSVIGPDQFVEVLQVTDEKTGKFETIIKGRTIRVSREIGRENLFREVRLIRTRDANAESGEKQPRIAIWIY